MRKVLFVTFYPLNQMGGGERYTLEAFRSVHSSSDSCVGYALSNLFAGDTPLAQRLRKQFRPFHIDGIIEGPSISFHQLLALCADYDVLWVHQYLSSTMIFDMLGNAGSDQAVILTGHGHEVETNHFGACFQPCSNVSIVEVSEYAALRSRGYGPRVWGVSAGVWSHNIITPPVASIKSGQICSTGRVLPHKGIEITLAAAPEGSILKIIGPKNLDLSYTKYLSTVRKRAKVEYLGEVSDTVKQKIMS
jgi:glycosyltransferase involved in cell wall biosynthesis